VIGYASATSSVVYAETWDQEGTGSGCNLVFSTGGKQEEVPVYQPGEDKDAKSKEVLPGIVARLRGYTRIPGVAWTNDMPIPGFAATLRWESKKIVGYPSDKKKGVTLATPTAMKTHVATPTSVHFTGDRLIVIAVHYDPGAKYVDYNDLTKHEVIQLPVALSPSPAATPAATASPKP
jgi:hypothetical protein